MSCIITYKGKQYSEENFKEYFINNKQEFATSITKNKDVINSFKIKMEAIDGVFKDSPELASIGSKAQYLQYLSTIFKTSKVKDIVYHGTDKEFEIFKKPSEVGSQNRMIAFADDVEYAKIAGNRRTPLKKIISALVNINKLYPVDKLEAMELDSGYRDEVLNELKKEGVDGFTFESDDDLATKNFNEVLVFEPEQIHILGSKQDIEGFKEFVNNRQENNVQFQDLSNNQVNYTLKAISIISNNLPTVNRWFKQLNNTDLFWNKVQQKLQIPKEQLELLRNSEGNTIEEKLLDFSSKYSQVIEINVATQKGKGVPSINTATYDDFQYNGDTYTLWDDGYEQDYQKNGIKTTKEEFDIAYNNTKDIQPSLIYPDLTAPGNREEYESIDRPYTIGDWKYKELKIQIPNISLASDLLKHEPFNEPSTIAHVRASFNKKTGEVVIHEFQSDPFQDNVKETFEYKVDEINGESYSKIEASKVEQNAKNYAEQLKQTYNDVTIKKITENGIDKWQVNGRERKSLVRNVFAPAGYDNSTNVNDLTLLSKDYKEATGKTKDFLKENQFLQFLNQKDNWISYGIKAIIQYAAKQGFTSVKFPTGNLAVKIEGGSTVEELKKVKEDRIKELEETLELDIRNYETLPDGNAASEVSAQINNKKVEINQLKKELQTIETQGLEDVFKGVYNFYENTVKNILQKQGYNPTLITDEYGNQWNEINIIPERDLSSIQLQTGSDFIPTKQSSTYDYIFEKLFDNFKPYVTELTTDRDRANEILQSYDKGVDYQDTENSSDNDSKEIQSKHDLLRTLYKMSGFKLNNDRWLSDPSIVNFLEIYTKGIPNLEEKFNTLYEYYNKNIEYLDNLKEIYTDIYEEYNIDLYDEIRRLFSEMYTSSELYKKPITDIADFIPFERLIINFTTIYYSGLHNLKINNFDAYEEVMQKIYSAWNKILKNGLVKNYERKLWLEAPELHKMIISNDYDKLQDKFYSDEDIDYINERRKLWRENDVEYNYKDLKRTAKRVTTVSQELKNMNISNMPEYLQEYTKVLRTISMLENIPVYENELYKFGYPSWVKGIYNPNNNEVYMNKLMDNYSLIHEINHALLAVPQYFHINFKRGIKEIIQLLKDNVGEYRLRQHYAFMNPDEDTEISEFIAEVLINHELQRELATIPLNPEDILKADNLWEKFLTVLSNLFKEMYNIDINETLLGHTIGYLTKHIDFYDESLKAYNTSQKFYGKKQHPLTQRGVTDITSIIPNDKGGTFLMYDLTGKITGRQTYNSEGIKNPNDMSIPLRYSLKGLKDANQIFGLHTYNPDSPVLFIVEGVFDALMLHQQGLPAIAVLTANPDKSIIRQVRLLNGKKIVIADNDVNNSDLRLKKLSDEIIVTPIEKDLNDLYINNPTEFKNFITKLKKDNNITEDLYIPLRTFDDTTSLPKNSENHIIESKSIEEIYAENPNLKKFINSILDENDDISLLNVKKLLNEGDYGRHAKLNNILYNALDRLWNFDISSTNNLQIFFVDSLPDNAIGQFDRESNSIVIDLTKFLNIINENYKNDEILYLGYLLNHEIIHYLTPDDLSLKIEYIDRALNGKFGRTFDNPIEKEFGKNIKELYDIAISQIEDVSDYGFTNLAEFVAEAMSNPVFQEILASIPYKSSKKSLWKKFIEVISSYLTKYTGKPIDNTLLEAVLAEITNYISQTSNIPKTYKIRTEDNKTFFDINNTISKSIKREVSNKPKYYLNVGESIKSNIQVDEVVEQVIDLPINQKLVSHILPLLNELNGNGYEPLIVGGAVRDALLGIKPKDIDIEVYGTTLEVLESILTKYGKVDAVGKAFGILKFIPYDKNGNLVQIDEPFDFSIPRRENKVGLGYKGFETEFSTDITKEEAATRRDFTWNAIGYNPITKTLYDFFGGIGDLKNGIIRHTSEKFSEDPLRIYRAMQFQARMGHNIAPGTFELMKSIVNDTNEFDHLASNELYNEFLKEKVRLNAAYNKHLKKGIFADEFEELDAHNYYQSMITRERLKEEWIKWAEKGKYHSKIFDFLRQSGLGQKLYPELLELESTQQDSVFHPEGNVEEHTMQVLAKMNEILTGDEAIETIPFQSASSDKLEQINQDLPIEVFDKLEQIKEKIKQELPIEIFNQLTFLKEVPLDVLGRDALYLSLKSILQDNGVTDEILINWAGVNKDRLGNIRNIQSTEQLTEIIQKVYDKKQNEDNYVEFKINPLALESFNKWKKALSKYPIAFQDLMLTHAIKYLINPDRTSKYVLQLSDVALTNAYGILVNKPHEANRIGKLYDQEVLKTVSDALGHEPSASGKGYWVHIPRTDKPKDLTNIKNRIDDLENEESKWIVKLKYGKADELTLAKFNTHEEAKEFSKNVTELHEIRHINKNGNYTFYERDLTKLAKLKQELKDLENNDTSAQFATNVELLKKLSPHTWCTAGGLASHYVENYDNALLIVNGITVAGVEIYSENASFKNQDVLNMLYTKLEENNKLSSQDLLSLLIKENIIKKDCK